MKKKIGDITVEVPFWYRANRKFISDFFENSFSKLFKKEFLEWDEYKKKIEKIEENIWKFWDEKKKYLDYCNDFD